MRKNVFVLTSIILAMLVGCGKENKIPADTAETEKTETITIANTETTAENEVSASPEKEMTVEPEGEEEDVYPGLNVCVNPSIRDYRKENTYFQKAAKKVALLDFSSFAGNDEIQEYQYTATKGENTDDVEKWDICLLNENGFSKEFGNELLELVKEQIPDAEIDDEANIVSYINDNAVLRVSINLSSENAIGVHIEAERTSIPEDNLGEQDGPVSKSEWVICSTDYNFNLQETYAPYRQVDITRYSYADHSDFVDALLKDVYGINMENFSGTNEIDTFNVYATAVIEDDEQYAQHWSLDLFSKNGTMFSDDFMKQFCSLYQKSTGTELEKSKAKEDTGITSYSARNNTNGGRVKTNVVLSNDPGGRKMKVMTENGEETEISEPANGDIMLMGEINSDRYQKQTTD